VTPATLADARGMLWTALEDPDPVLIFEHGGLYNVSGDLAADTGPVDIDRAAIRRSGEDVTLITYGGTLPKTLEAAEQLASDGIAADVIDAAGAQRWPASERATDGSRGRALGGSKVRRCATPPLPSPISAIAAWRVCWV
jgi:pyruvate/2-oxoglutarate/acetoin dehydrogenase E1 component